MNITAIVNLKGGVGKTTTAINLAALSAEEGKRTLLIDNDIQGSAGKAFGIKKDRKNPDVVTLADALHKCDAQTMRAAIHATKYPNLHVIPGGMDLVAINNELSKAGGLDALTRLKKCLQYIDGGFVQIYIDNAPNLTPNVINSFVVADEIIIPMEPDGLSADGVEEVIEQVKNLKKARINSNIKLAGILLTRFNDSYKIHKEARHALEQNGYPVFKTAIHASIKVTASINQMIPLVHYAKKARPAQDYRKLYDELKNVPNLGIK